ncbi:MAG: ATP-binding protein [Ancrocorticia sp.]|jgi:two-component system sensor histidine kinase SenX3|nr:ATP-binding protein [Ancrocorticia sp.]MCI2002152.1 ATP-binding protein [Ancrocorticia sp.]
MSTEVAILVAALLGVLVGAWATYAFLYTERQRRSERVQTPDDDDKKIVATAILDALPQDYVILDRSNTVEKASTRAYSYGIVHGNQIVRPEMKRLVDATRQDGLIHAEEVRMSRSMLEQELESRLMTRTAPMSEGKVLILFEDNTAQSRLEETRRDFTANISHELKTPIGAISLLAETLYDNAEDAEAVRHFSTQLGKEATRLSQLVQDIIELSRLQAGDALSTSDLVSIDEVVEEAVDRMRIEAEDRGIRLVAGGQKGHHVYGDKKLLVTAVRNLLDNALRYSHRGSQVSVGVTTHDGLVSIAVVDQGEGISPAQRDRVFERFFRGDASRSRDYGGSGLGLSIVKHVVSDHGGRVTLWSVPGKGSTFTILLPEAATDGVAASARDARSVRSETSAVRLEKGKGER